jgi:ABC-type sulfate transport system permease subunit
VPTPHAQDRIPTYQLVCGVIMMTPILYVVLATVLRSAGVIPDTGIADSDPEAVPVVSLALLMGGTVSSITSLGIKTLLLRASDAHRQGPGARFKVALISMAISESGAVMGLVLILLTGDLLFGGLLCGLSFAVTCFHFPSRHWLEQGSAVV